jgi:cytoskeletal protein RodZ
MAASLGEQLRLAREARSITLREISEQTRISTRYLEAIEADDYKRLPGGIFNKSFIKAYARYIGFDETEALESYIQTAREQGATPDEVATTPHHSRVYTDGNGVRSPLITILLTVLILAILSLGVYAALHWYQRRAANRNESSPAPGPTTQAANQQAGPATSATPPPAAAGLNVQIKAVGDRVWVRTSLDEGKSSQAILAPDETREFKPAQSLKIEFAKVKAGNLELTINGRAARVPAEAKTDLVEIVITNENYEQLLQ